MRVPRPLFAFAALAVLGAALPARADITVPGRVETCTMEKQAKAGLECHECRAYHGNPDHCPASLSSYGFKQACRSGGASVWSEIWCRAPGAGAAKVPPELLGQLGNPSSIAPAANTAAPGPAPTNTGPAPANTAAPGEEPVPENVLPAGPPPVPPPQGCGCSVIGEGDAPLAASLLAAVAAAAVAIRRRRR